MPMYYAEIFKLCKNDNLSSNFLIFSFFFAQNIDCRYTLDETLRGVEIFVIDLHQSYVISSNISIILAKDLS